MTSLVHQRCYHHPAREAVARCPECRRHFCRECVVEHGDRVLCAACLRKLVASAPVTRHWLRPLLQLAGAVSGGTLLWLAFYLLGQLLLAIPLTFHEGTLWQSTWLNEP